LFPQGYHHGVMPTPTLNFVSFFLQSKYSTDTLFSILYSLHTWIMNYVVCGWDNAHFKIMPA